MKNLLSILMMCSPFIFLLLMSWIVVKDIVLDTAFTTGMSLAILTVFLAFAGAGLYE